MSIAQKITKSSLASQTSFTLTAGSADDDAYNNCTIIVSDIASAIQKCIGRISDYTGSSKTVTLVADPGIFTMAASDQVSIIATSALANVASWLSTAVTTSSTSAKPEVDVNSVSDDATAANNLETACDNYSATRGLTGTALPAVAADGAGGVPISDAGGLDLDALNTNINDIETDTADMQPRVVAIEVDTGTTLDARIPSALVSGRMDASIDATGFEAAAVDLVWDEVRTCNTIHIHARRMRFRLNAPIIGTEAAHRRNGQLVTSQNSVI